MQKFTRTNSSFLLRETRLTNGKKLSVRQGVITWEHVDAIVNNTTSQLVHDDGLALSISQKGGPEIQKESTKIME